jgi:flagellar motor switch protein FliN
MPNQTIDLETETTFTPNFGMEGTEFADDAETELGAESGFMADGYEEMAPAAADLPPAQPNLDVIMNIPVTMQVVLGSTVMPVANLMKLGRGAVVKLDTNVSDPVDLMVNGRIVARGEVVVLENEDQRFGITLTEIVSPAARQPRSKSAGAS